MSKLTLTIPGRTDYKNPGCRWIDTTYGDVLEIERIWKNAIQMKSVVTGITVRFSKHTGMKKENGWYPLKGKLFKRSFELTEDGLVPENVDILNELSYAVTR